METAKWRNPIRNNKPKTAISFCDNSVQTDKKVASKLSLSVFLIFPVVAILILSFALIQGSLGRFTRSILLSDSAVVSKFDVIITPPNELMLSQGENAFEYDFISVTDAKLFDFHIFNNGEVDVICTPGVTNNIRYKVLIAGEEVEEFIVTVKESVSFQLRIEPQGLSGLSASRTDATLFVDIHQTEGGA